MAGCFSRLVLAIQLGRQGALLCADAEGGACLYVRRQGALLCADAEGGACL